MLGCVVSSFSVWYLYYYKEWNKSEEIIAEQLKRACYLMMTFDNTKFDNMRTTDCSWFINADTDIKHMMIA